MSNKTSIQWTDATWNPVRGCSRVSPGCTNCYAERVAARFSGEEEGIETGGPEGWRTTKPEGPFRGFATQSPPRWTGKVALVEKHLLDPLRWRKPRRIFVNSMSDLFHESLPDEAIDRVFAVMALAPRHTFQILTKRAERMRSYLSLADRHNRIELAAEKVRRGPLNGKHVLPRLPLPNVWLGVSAEDQQRADERIPLLLQTPAAVRFVSAEPLLGPINLWSLSFTIDTPRGGADRLGSALDWIIVGGESGPGARPCDLAWVRAIVEQCKAAGVACFVKQLGAVVRDRNDAGFHGPPGDWPLGAAGADRETVEDPSDTGYQGAPVRVLLRDRKGGGPAEWPEDLRVREFPR